MSFTSCSYTPLSSPLSLSLSHTHTHTHTNRHRHRHRDADTDRHTDTHTHTQTHTQTQTQTHTDTHTDTDTDTHTRTRTHMRCGLKRVAKNRTYSYQLPFIIRRVFVVTTLLYLKKKNIKYELAREWTQGRWHRAGTARELPQSKASSQATSKASVTEGRWRRAGTNNL